MPEHPDGDSRRDFLAQATAAALLTALPAEGKDSDTTPVTLTVNGTKHDLTLDPG